MQEKPEPANLPESSLKIGRQQLVPNPVIHICEEEYNWYEKALLAMIREKGIVYNLQALSSVFHAIRMEQSANSDAGEIIYIIDQFARRLETIQSSDKLAEIALICAIAGMKTACDLAIWNVDLLKHYNSHIVNFFVGEQISQNRINELERQHLLILDYVVQFTEKSHMEERFHKILHYLDRTSILILEKELQKLQSRYEGAKVGDAIQKAIFKNTGQTTAGFFRKGSIKSKTNDDIPLEKNMMLSPVKRELAYSR